MRLLLLSDSQYVCTKNKPCIPFVCVSQSVFEILEVRVEGGGGWGGGGFLFCKEDTVEA